MKQNKISNMQWMDENADCIAAMSRILQLMPQINDAMSQHSPGYTPESLLKWMRAKADQLREAFISLYGEGLKVSDRLKDIVPIEEAKLSLELVDREIERLVDDGMKVMLVGGVECISGSDLTTHVCNLYGGQIPDEVIRDGVLAFSWLTPTQAAARLKCEISTLHALVASGGLPAVRFSRQNCRILEIQTERAAMSRRTKTLNDSNQMVA